jgi:hypothetical protein
MTGVALLDRSFDQASAPESCGESRLPATSVAQKSCHHELFGLGRFDEDVWNLAGKDFQKQPANFTLSIR